MNVRIATFAPFPSPRDAMPYRCKKKHKQGDIVEIGGEKYIITEDSIPRYEYVDDPWQEDMDWFATGKYITVYRLDDIVRIYSDAPLELEGFTELYWNGVYVYRSERCGTGW